MTTSVQQLFEQAQLAEASYSLFDRVNFANTNEVQDALTLAEFGGKFSTTQAAEFVKQWRVVDHIPDTTSGFSATLFERLDASRNGTGEFNLAIRGSTFDNLLLDFRADAGDIFLDGMVLDQLVDLYNYWQRLSTPATSTYTAAKLVTLQAETLALRAAYVLGTAAGLADEAVLRARGNVIIDHGLVPTAVTVRTVQFVDSSALSDNSLRQGAGFQGDILELTASGHSLGGHLAMAFTRLFSGANASALAVNGLGFRPTNSNVDRMFALLGGAPGFDAAKICNVFGLEGPEFAAQNTFLLSQVGGYQGIYIESAAIFAQALGHSAAQMTDSLAVYDLFAKIDSMLNTTDPAVGIGKITDMLKAASNKSALSLEAALDSLRKLFQDPAVQNLTPTATDNRDQFYENLFDVGFQGRMVFFAGQLSISRLTDISSTDLSNLASGSSAFAFRYALKELNPFAVVGNNTLYDRHNQAGELNLYDPAATMRAGMTTQYIADRAQMLVFANTANTNDTNSFGSNQVVDQVRYTDLGKVAVGNGGDFVVFLPGGVANFNGPNTRRVTFGTDSTDSLVGRNNTDRLYGDGGADVLSGNGGDDYLEGGNGLDVYNYNASSSSGNDGQDIILDTDGRGVLRYVFRDGVMANAQNTVVAEASVRVSGVQWQSADAQFSYTRSGEDLVVTVNTPGGGNITLKNFKDGDFGIRLWEARIAPDFAATENIVSGGSDEANTLTGTAAADLIRAFGNDDAVSAGGGDDIVEGGTGNDILDGQTGNDRIYGEAGNDQVTGGPGDDEVYGGGGQDFVSDSGGTNLVEGNAGGDILYAFGSGRDEFFADSRVALSTAIMTGEQSGTNLRGDWIMSGADADLVVGGADNDVLMGGGGSDIVVGGPGDDNIEGDLGWITNTFSWTATRNVGTQPDGSLFHQLVYDPAVELDVSAGGADVIYAGGGVDWVRGGANDDFVDAGSGDDKIWGEAGSDVLLGGLGNDLLVGDNPGVVAGANEGGDYLDGGAGNDTLEGNGGADVLVGGAGNDTLVGGAGKDIYLFNKGDGTDTVFDINADSNSPDASVLVLGEGFSRSAIKFRLGSLAVDLGAMDPSDPNSPHEVIHFEGFDQVTPTNSTPIGEIRFSDGSSMSYEDIQAQGFDIDGTEESDDNHDAAHPQLLGTGVTDRIRGLGGNDVLAGLDGDDFLYGDVGSDTLHGGAGNDYLEGGDGFDTLNGGIGDDTYVYDTFDTITDSQGANRIVFGAGIAPENLSVTSFVVSGTPRLLIERPGATGAGLDLRGTSLTSSSFVYSFADGRTLSQTELLQTAYFGAQTINGTAGNDTLTGFAGNDTISGLGGNDTISGGAGDDSLDGGTEDDTLFGGAGNDLLRGLFGNDTLAGGAGSDTLVGFDGADTYVFGYGDGSDTVTDSGNDAGVDSARLADGISVADVTLTHQPNGDLTVTLNSTQDQLKLPGWYTSGSRVEQVVFGDGTVITEAELAAISVAPISGTAVGDFLTGTPYDDTLQGAAGDDVLDGGRNTFFLAFVDFHGNDLLIGGEGNDTYVLGWRNERDTVIEQPGEISTIRLGPDMTFDDVDARREGDDLFVHGRRTEHGLLLKNYYTQAHDWHIETASGASMTLPAFLALPAPTTGDPVRDLWEARQTEFKHEWYASAEELLADGTLRDPPTTTVRAHIFQTVDNGVVTRTTGLAAVPLGVSQIDTTFGPATIVSSDAASQFSSFANTTGTTTVIDATFDVAWDPTAVSRTTSFLGTFVGFDLLIHSLYRSEVIFSLSGTVEGITLNSTNGASGPDIVNAVTNGGAVPEAVRGTFHSTTDTFSLVEIYGGPSSNAISHRTSGMVDGGAGNDVIDAVAGGFSSTGAGGNFLYGGAGNDGITGSGDPDLICGGPGNDTLAGWSNDDTYYFFASDPGVDIVNEATWYLWDWYDGLAGIALFAADSGQLSEDTIEFGPGINLADLTLSWGTHQSRYWISPSLLKTYETLDIFWDAGNGVRVMMPDRLDPDVRKDMTIHSPGRSWGIEHFKFADGTTLSLQEMIDRIPAQVWNGSAGDDFFEGGAGNNEFFGGTGFDELYGAFGIDVYHYNLGDGQDAIHDPGGTDKVVFGAGITPEMLSLGVGSLLVRVGSSGDALRIDYFDVNDPFRTGAIETYEFADSTTLTHAELLARGFDLFGTDASETLTGTSLTDRLRGGAGNDFYFIALGSGADTVEDEAGDFDTVFLGGSITPESVTVTRAGDFLTLALNAADRIAIRWQPQLGYQIEQVQFGDGTLWDAATLEAMAVPAGGNTAPALVTAIADQTATEDAAFSLTVPADAFSDPDAGDTLTYAASHPDGSPLPGWISFDDSTRTFAGTPANGDVGSLDVKMTATDGSGASVSDTFAVSVANTNDAPTVANVIADQITAEDAVFNFQVPTNTFTDVDVGDTLAYSATLADGSAPPAWLTFDPASRTFSGTPGNGDVGTLNVRVTATDTTDAAASDEFALEVVNVNDTPSLIAPLADQFGNQNAAISFQVPSVAFMDPDAGDTLTLSAAPITGGALPAWLAFDSATGTFSGTPSEFDVVAMDIRVTATDNAGATAGGTFTLSISDASTVNETHVGTHRRDVIVTGIANDLIDAGRGDDIVHAGAGRDIVFGGRSEDLLYGEAGNDRLYGGKGDDQLYGGLGHDLLYGGRGGDKLEGGEGADLLSGGAGHDLLTGGAGENLLIGGAGRDTITGGPGGDVFLVNLDDGRDELHLTGAALEGNQDVLSLGGGIGADDIHLMRDQGDLIVEARDADNHYERARVILKDWYRDAGDHQTVTTLQLFDGGNAVNYDFKALVTRFDSETEGRDPTSRWSTEHALPAVQLAAGASPLGGDISREYAMSGAVLGNEPLADEDAEERSVLPGGDWDRRLTLSAREDPASGSMRERDRDDGHLRKDKRESLGDMLEAYLAQNPQYEFEAFVQELGRPDRHGEVLSAQDIARRWQAVGRYGNGLSNENDDDGRRGAMYRFNEQGLLESGAFGGGIGYTGSTGVACGIASLRALQGLEEGFQRLRS